ncbi:MAG: replicative DNA helicase, partial [Oscillospiraceae bacterium]|nr:replicative DNA helicase [Oscillospiraceae bacterium]
MADTAVLDSAVSFSEQDLPNSLEAEQSVLGAILLNPESLSTAVEYVKPESFYLPQHRELFRLMVGLFTGAQGTQMDIIVILNEAVREGIFETPAEGKRYLTSLAENVPTAENITSYCQIIQEKYCARCLALIAKDLLKEIAAGTETAQTLLDSAEQRIYDIRQGRDVRGLIPIKDVMIETYRHLGDISGPDRDKFVGAKTGYSQLDAITGGMNNSDLVILAARPGMGKTSFALNLAANVARSSGKNIAIYSLEMSMEQLVSRMLSTHALVDSHKLRTGRLAPEEWSRLAASADVLMGMNIMLSEATGITVPKMKAQLRRVKNLGMVVIDYLQLMDAPLKSENRVLVISDITRNLKLMAKELNVPVLLLSQLNRAVESRPDKHPQLSDLRESGSIEQDADIIMFLYNDFYYNREKSERPNITECIVAKNRHGETSKIDLVWDAQFTRFSTPEKTEAP